MPICRYQPRAKHEHVVRSKSSHGLSIRISSLPWIRDCIDRACTGFRMSDSPGSRRDGADSHDKSSASDKRTTQAYGRSPTAAMPELPCTCLPFMQLREVSDAQGPMLRHATMHPLSPCVRRVRLRRGVQAGVGLDSIPASVGGASTRRERRPATSAMYCRANTLVVTQDASARDIADY